MEKPEDGELRMLVKERFKREKLTKALSKAKGIADLKKTILVERLTK